jgi:ABC-2 type transport system ATP-binding protein
MTTQAPVDARGLSKTYRLGFWFTRRVQALRDLDLTVSPGEVYGVLGPNGAGKSTTIKILMNLVQPSAGSATLFGLPPTDKRCRALVGFVPENPAPYEYLSGREFGTKRTNVRRRSWPKWGWNARQGSSSVGTRREWFSA